MGEDSLRIVKFGHHAVLVFTIRQIAERLCSQQNPGRIVSEHFAVAYISGKHRVRSVAGLLSDFPGRHASSCGAGRKPRPKAGLA